VDLSLVTAAPLPEMLSEKYLHEVIESKDLELAGAEADANQVVVAWAICDGVLVIYDHDNPPVWFNFPRDENGNSIEFTTASLTAP
jgi:hypothetical protein